MISICAVFVCGCGTTKWSDTKRTGTEQLLISNAIDRVVANVDFSPMQNKRCYLDTSAIEYTTDRDYLAMAVRQHLAIAGAILAASEEDADYIVEVRAGAVGTDRDELLVGIPATTLPAFPGSPYSATSIPEIPFLKSTKQRGVAKVALFAYRKDTGRPIWASGNRQEESGAQNLWFAGAGPLTRGTIYHEPTFAGNTLPQTIRKMIREPDVNRKEKMLETAHVFEESSPIRPPEIPERLLIPRRIERVSFSSEQE